MTSGVDEILYSHAPRAMAMNRNTGSTCQIISDIKSISSEKRNASEQVAKYCTCVDAVVLLYVVCHTRAVAGPAFRVELVCHEWHRQSKSNSLTVEQQIVWSE